MAKIKISTANGRKLNRHYLPSVTLTTSDVGSLQPVNIVQVRHGEHINVNFSQFSQSQPTAVRTFGSFNLHTHAFFVPLKSVWRHYEDWIVDSADASIEASTTPTFKLGWLYKSILGLYENSNSLVWDFYPTVYVESPFVFDKDETDEWSTDDADKNLGSYDLAIHRDGYDGVSNYSATNLTPRGRLLFKVLRGLGYEIPVRFDLMDGEPAIFNQEYDLTPLLCFCRIFYDWVYPSQYVQQQGFGALFEQDVWTSPQLSKLLDLLFVPMREDFFTSLWLKPNERALGSHAVDIGSKNFKDDNYNLGSLNLTGANDATMLSQSSSNDRMSLTAESLRWLESMSDYVIRNNIGGTRFHEWMKAHFGYVTSEQDSNRSIFLKSFTDSLNFSPVTASTGTDSQLLGQMAGNGSSQGGGKLKFECKQDGFLIFVHLVTPVVAYYQGLKPWCKKLASRYDLYTPELDSVGMEPISRSEVYNSHDSFASLIKVPQNTYDNAFGFSPRYADRYKRGNSFLNGDFRLGSRNSDLEAYHTFRDVLYNRNNLALDAQFMSSDNQYNRVFAYPLLNNEGDSRRDHIETLFTFDIERYSTASSIGDSMPIFNRSGRDVSLDNGGTQLN